MIVFTPSVQQSSLIFFIKLIGNFIIILSIKLSSSAAAIRGLLHLFRFVWKSSF